MEIVLIDSVIWCAVNEKIPHETDLVIHYVLQLPRLMRIAIDLATGFSEDLFSVRVAAIQSLGLWSD